MAYWAAFRLLYYDNIPILSGHPPASTAGKIPLVSFSSSFSFFVALFVEKKKKLLYVCVDETDSLAMSYFL